jgi:hypothetical protein
MFPNNSNRTTRKTIRLLSISTLLALMFLTLALGTDQTTNANQQTELWADIKDPQLQVLVTAAPDVPHASRLLQLNETLFSSLLSQAPLEFTQQVHEPEVLLSLPLPDGRTWRFRIAESPVLSPELATKFPEIKTYSGQSIDDPTATVRFSWTPKGLNAFVISEQGTFVVVPVDSDNRYVSYFTHDLEAKSFQCSNPVQQNASTGGGENDMELSVTTGTLRRYRIAVTVTPEFIFTVGGETIAGNGTIAAVTNYVNNVRAIYEREIGVSFTIAAVWNPAAFPPPFTAFLQNGNLQQMGQANQTFLDNLFVPGFSGAASYDVGFALGFSPQAPSGLVQELGCACQPFIKAHGAALVTGPSTNDYWGSVVMAHEIGHMFGGIHTFTPITTQECAQAAVPPEGRVEPGSGSTIMSYAAACGSDKLFTGEPNSAANSFFHIHTLLRIRDHKAAFPACGQTLNNGNSPPVITNPGTGGFIPAFTPFMLTAAATDPNGDPLTYAWEEFDIGTPLFRTYVPSSNPSRMFPSLTYILNNGNVPPLFVGSFFSGEALPQATRTLNFTVTVRDNRSVGGGTTARDQLLQVNVVGTAGPFRVTQPNAPVTLSGGEQTTVTWNVANTNFAPISTAAVRILLSTDGGNTFPTVLANSTANDGFEVVTLPNVQTTTARVKIEAVGNIYFDISDTNFAINSVSSTVQLSASAYSGSEASGNIGVTVTRSGNTSGTASVNYITSDTAGLQNCATANGRASERCDYVTSAGTVGFAAGETSKTLFIPVINDVLVEGNETFTLALSNASGASLGSTASATVTITDNDVVVPASNPIDGVEFFIRQQYLDFLNRQPDSTGLQNWINTLAPCPNGGLGEPPTSTCDRLHVAEGFFLSDEFLNRGYWAFRFYMVSQNQRPNYAQFIPDMAQVGGPKSPAEEDASKIAFAEAFVQRPEFLARYGGLTGQPLANALLQTAGLPSSTFTVTGLMTNGQVLRGVVETGAVFNRFLTEGKVSIQYFGFLRRDPDSIGYQNNVNTLNSNPNNLRHMIFIFIYSTEYRSRFGP